MQTPKPQPTQQAAQGDRGPGPEIYIRVWPLRSEYPWPVRLKRALKHMLRTCQLRAQAFVDAAAIPDTFREVEPDPEHDATKFEPPF